MFSANFPLRSRPSHRVVVFGGALGGLESLKSRLRAWGHQVETAEDALRGVERALRWRPNAALVDVSLPGALGYEVVRRLRLALRDDILLIALTAPGDSDEAKRTFPDGYDLYFSKPVKLEALRRVLAWSRELLWQAAYLNRVVQEVRADPQRWIPAPCVAP